MEKMINKGICPYCNSKMEYENGENGENTEFWWECKCGRSYDSDTGKDITDYECTDVDFKDGYTETTDEITEEMMFWNYDYWLVANGYIEDNQWAKQKYDEWRIEKGYIG